jgi:hypothetical protein
LDADQFLSEKWQSKFVELSQPRKPIAVREVGECNQKKRKWCWGGFFSANQTSQIYSESFTVI